ncbi:MAG TPA: DUF4294 domain-containing protein [Chitinophagaceae bacterium]|nr:DUF4294 domain-containing protein [Chitinophagaceae bacterium]
MALALYAGQAVAQQTPPTAPPMPPLGPNDTIPVPANLFQNEWLPAKSLEWVWVQAPLPPHLKKKKAEWTRLRNAVYVTYPYAKRAGDIMNDINQQLVNVTSESKRKSIIKSREKELKKEFTKPMSDLSVYQGKVLMKLINRQTGNNCYEIIKEYKGGFTARCWQTVAFFFGSNLKQPYNPSGDDLEMELIVMEVERMYK